MLGESRSSAEESWNKQEKKKKGNDSLKVSLSPITHPDTFIGPIARLHYATGGRL